MTINLCQDIDVGQVEVKTSVGYALKRAAWALRGAMDAELRGLGLGVPQYACLELLHQRPGISNADLARGVFSTRQATHQLLGGLREAGLIEIHGQGRNQRLALTPHGSRVLTEASEAVADIEERMIATLDADGREALRDSLEACVESLTAPIGPRRSSRTPG